MPHFDLELDELSQLALTAGLKPVAKMTCKRKAPDAKREALRDEGGANPMVVRASDLAEAVRARVAGQGGDVMAVAAPLMLRGDGFALAALLSALIGHLRAQDAERTGFRLEIAEEGAG